MKKIISFVLVFSIVFAFTVPCYADFTTTDSNHLSSIYQSVNSGGALYSIVNQVKNSLTSGGALYTLVNTINSNILNLFRWTSGDGNTYSVAQMLNSIANDTFSLANSAQTNNSNLVNLLGYSDNGVVKPWLADIYQSTYGLNSRLNSIYNLQSTNLPQIYSLQALHLPDIASRLYYQNKSATNYLYDLYTLDGLSGGEYFSNLTATVRSLNSAMALTDNTVNFSNRNWRSSIVYLLWSFNNAQVLANNKSLSGFNSSQTSTSWLTLQGRSFTPTSAINGVYRWFSELQTPLARLAYVHASDEEIAARSAAAPNQEAFVDNFIDSSGRASASVSDIQSVSGMSSSFKESFSTGVAPSAIFQIFDSAQWGWFSQATANQLDTTNPPTRMLRSLSTSFDTPLLDEQIQSIYTFIGGN